MVAQEIISTIVVQLTTCKPVDIWVEVKCKKAKFSDTVRLIMRATRRISFQGKKFVTIQSKKGLLTFFKQQHGSKGFLCTDFFSANGINSFRDTRSELMVARSLKSAKSRPAQPV